MEGLSQFISFIHQHDLFNSNERILLAVSAGRDSVLMAHYFKAAGFDFGIAHCNFSLRQTESDLDENFVSELASTLDVPFFSVRFETEQYAHENHISIQMAARDLRYQWLEEIRTDFDYQYIALAHHKNDLVETVLLNLVRGTGIAGLHGILAKRNRLIRPLLFLSREEIDEITRSEQISYRDDSSNFSSKYARNKIRLEVIPALKELNPQLENTFIANTNRFAELEILLNDTVESLRKSIFKQIQAEDYVIDLPKLKKIKPLKTLLYGLFKPFGFTESVLNDLVSVWDGIPGKVFYSNTYQLILDRNTLILNKKINSKFSQTLIDSSGEFNWDAFCYKSSVTESENFTLIKSSSICQADFSLLQFPLKLRNWQNGDYFFPIGMKGKKKLSDFFVSEKVPLNRKTTTAILENGNGDIIWISGMRMDDRYKVTGSSEKVFILEKQTIHGK